MADVVDIGHRLFALSKTELRHRKMIGVLQFGQMQTLDVMQMILLVVMFKEDLDTNTME